MSLHDLRLSAARRVLGLGSPEAARARRKAALQTSSILASRLAVETLEPRLLLAAEQPTIESRLDVAGETDAFTVKITEPGTS